MERRAFHVSGFLMVLLGLLAIGGGLAVLAADGDPADGLVVGVLLGLSAVFILVITGLTIVNPGDARVIQLFGHYVGTIRTPGLHWTWPLTTKQRLTLRVRNFETERLKVSDADGNPVEIAAVIVWQVTDTAKAAFAVDNHVNFVQVQAESSVRHLATSYPYEAHDTGRASLRQGELVSGELIRELAERVELAGVEIVDARITHLAYASEIAQAMLARQQAAAIVSARFIIVEGAVSMVGTALDRLREQGLVELDEERKAQMVSNLLVVLCSDRATQPVINAGTLY
ncbi:DNA-binding transcriptional ArsR family regulator [Allocatelliglobosispora scoriae]|uniref:DNA-binding transcriptional ArsR family regulator n=1 Tax=Allocatelliglobosispora scoriae TaxID=643052 RepID=A0A841BZ74_9ACTN|nr:SPFH domain-containing protein [Allocatelliglobosispora scoriae]MBB5872020.1 DNA-binding transcriptional ArsR family regulator [Allocatelliglobosispora scoriae]